MYKSILVPTDGSEFSDMAVKEAANLAKEFESGLNFFYYFIIIYFNALLYFSG